MDDELNPQHYQTDAGIEAIEVIERYGLGLHMGTSFKYVSRLDRKHPGRKVIELGKSMWYVDRWLGGQQDGRHGVELPSASDDPESGICWRTPEQIADAFGLSGYEREAMLDILEAAAFGDEIERITEARHWLEKAVEDAKSKSLPQAHAMSA